MSKQLQDQMIAKELFKNCFPMKKQNTTKENQTKAK